MSLKSRKALLKLHQFRKIGPRPQRPFSVFRPSLRNGALFALIVPLSLGLGELRLKLFRSPRKVLPSHASLFPPPLENIPLVSHLVPVLLGLLELC